MDPLHNGYSLLIFRKVPLRMFIMKVILVHYYVLTVPAILAVSAAWTRVETFPSSLSPQPALSHPISLGPADPCHRHILSFISKAVSCALCPCQACGSSPSTAFNRKSRADIPTEHCQHLVRPAAWNIKYFRLLSSPSARADYKEGT